MIEEQLRNLKPILQRDYFVETIGIFGSFANGTATENSDVDVLVSFDRQVGWEFFDLQFFLEKELNKKIDLVTVNGLKIQLKDKILAQTKYL